MVQATNENQPAIQLLHTLVEKLHHSNDLDFVQKAQAINCIEAIRSWVSEHQSPEKVHMDKLRLSVEASSELTHLVVQSGEGFGYLPSA